MLDAVRSQCRQRLLDPARVDFGRVVVADGDQDVAADPVPSGTDEVEGARRRPSPAAAQLGAARRRQLRSSRSTSSPREKISARGKESLTEEEKRFMVRFSERYRNRNNS